jgi:hypothetical protein
MNTDEEVIRLEKSQKMLVTRVENLLAIISDPTSPDYMALDAENKYAAAITASERMSALLQKERALGSIERQQLRKLRNSPYLRDRMNALALKTRLHDKLRSRKIELERTFRKQVNGTQGFSTSNHIPI